MNTFCISEMQEATVRLTLTERGRTVGYGLVVNVPGGPGMLVLPSRILDKKPETLFVHCLSWTGRDIALNISVTKMDGDSVARVGELAAFPVWSEPKGLVASLELESEETAEPDEGEFIVLLRKPNRILSLENAWYLESALAGDAGLPVFQTVPGKSQYGCLQGVVVGRARMTPFRQVFDLLLAAVSKLKAERS